MWEVESLQDQAQQVAAELARLRAEGVRYDACAVLLRSMRMGSLQLSSPVQRAFLQVLAYP